MFIFAVGSHGTGKTTAFRLVAQKRDELYIDGISRPIIRANLPISKAEHQELIDNLTIHIQKHFIDYPHLVYFTRNVFDCIAYAKVNVPYFDNEQKMIDFYRQIKDDSIFIYFPIEFELTSDAERSGNPIYQERVDNEISNLLDKYSVSFKTVAGPVEERVEQILGIVENAERFRRTE